MNTKFTAVYFSGLSFGILKQYLLICSRLPEEITGLRPPGGYRNLFFVERPCKQTLRQLLVLYEAKTDQEHLCFSFSVAC